MRVLTNLVHHQNCENAEELNRTWVFKSIALWPRVYVVFKWLEFDFVVKP